MISINRTQYAWSSLSFEVLGKTVVGIKAIKYLDEQEMENVYGAGNYPVGQAIGAVSYEGSLTLLQAEVQELVALVPTGRIQDIPAFDITVAFVAGTRRHKHILRSCKFKSNGVDSSQGDMEIEVEIPLLIGFIQFGEAGGSGL